MVIAADTAGDVVSKHSAHSVAAARRKAAVVVPPPGGIIPAPDDITKTMTEDQTYWDSQVEDYNEAQVFGPEISSTIAGASKIFWQKELSEERLKKTMESAKMPSNCKFLAVKQVNREIWTSTSPDIRTRDYSLQEVQKTHGAMSTAVLLAVEELNTLRAKTPANTSTIQLAIDKLKDSLKLAGRMNQQINKHRRDSFKPSIPLELKKLVDIPNTGDSAMLFGDNLKERIDEVKGENSVRNEFIKKNTYIQRSKQPTSTGNNRFNPYTKKNDHAKESNYQYQESRSNYRTPQKSRGGSSQGYPKRNNSNNQNDSKSRHQAKRGKKH